MYPYSEYLPPYLREIKEIKVLDSVITPDSEAAQGCLLQTYRNQFVALCDEETLRRKERVFQIFSDPNKETLDFRRQRLMNRYRLKFPLTMNFLLLRLNEIIGKDNYKAWISYGNWAFALGTWKLGQPFRTDPYTLHIETTVADIGWYHEVHVLVNKVKPANIIFSFAPMLQHMVSISETIGIYPMPWYYHLGYWALGRKPFQSVGDLSVGSWNHQLGTWTLGQKTFGNHAEMEVIKMPEDPSISSSFLAEHAKFSAAKIAKVRLNSTYIISGLQKIVAGNTTTIRYTIPALKSIGDITSIELLREDDTILMSCKVYIPIPKNDQVIMKHIIPHEEVRLNARNKTSG